MVERHPDTNSSSIREDRTIVSCFNTDHLDAPMKLRKTSKDNSGIRIRRKSKENNRLKSVTSKLSEYKNNINTLGRVAETNE